ncbi:MAG TPA: Glu/Leu/Phe/Val dehydrogenase [Candidatus Paceibacterota bacterium]|nr:Glu/Leu/Phe/Val dehydrogenase [Candidatus Paceibacterota bacterium]
MQNANPFQNALAQLKRAQATHSTSSGQVVLTDTLVERMSHADREISVSIPVVLDDGSTKIFEGYRVQHSNARGPYKGGVRFHLNADIDEVRALALWMSMKCAVANIPMGGGKGGVRVDPKSLSKAELERLSRGWVGALWRNLGPRVDVPAPDVNTTPEIMGWMLDEYQKRSNDFSSSSKAAFTGKAVANGGSLGRDKATGQGGFYVFDALREKFGIGTGVDSNGGVTVAIQGMGNVGGHAVEIFHAHGYKIVAMSDSKGAIYAESGLNPEEIEAYKKEHGSLAGYPNAKEISNAELLALKVDVLVPAALENQLTADNAGAVQAKLVLELANGPTTPEADDALFARNIPVVPDILANAGGVVVSTFEWEQNLKGEQWSEEDVNQKLKEILATEAAHIFARAAELKTDLRRAAFAVALERIGTALKV